MGRKDTQSKKFLRDNEPFADVFNYFAFGGEPVLKADELEERDSTELITVYGIEEKELHRQKWRDLIKHAIVKFANGTYFVLLGIENQTDIHYAMPVKVMNYDAINYAAQVTEAAKKHKERKDYGKDNADFLSGFQKTDKLTPVITLTLYWGSNDWDAPRSLHEMMADIPSELMYFIPDYRINLLIPSEITDFNKFKTSIGEVLEFIKASSDERSFETILDNNPDFQRLDNEAVRTINMFTGAKIRINKKEEKTNVCKAWEDRRLNGIRDGHAAGLTEGRLEMLSSYLSNDGVTDEDAKKFLHASDAEIEQARKLIKA